MARKRVPVTKELFDNAHPRSAHHCLLSEAANLHVKDGVEIVTQPYGDAPHMTFYFSQSEEWHAPIEVPLSRRSIMIAKQFDKVEDDYTTALYKTWVGRVLIFDVPDEAAKDE